ncbi:beta-hydroxyacyl-(acyl carrier protein) dehydratase FabZ [Desulfocapsa sulfexigens DSM 10523]|uniref:3-hydroxyacyl-[acyl-carrier-protein] dehydratase FabZ n=1 Tax=Desulfocapsa sulfexigens (strain DSM 10523 / SB164P1) TaxID=1167006 RepID=M1P9A5_DESSD|nr:3-hydroxyacyl-ACP dehydratase FabZ [Desulfocapsa sulfexigens]AGF80023.1 beta-hydroxyacyl-(acyl carrier protein) dehydratase FabZ [Desulfocapsa sulfexigens DSM 10523]
MSEELIENIDIIEILRLLPHRYPFVMIDRVLSLVPDQKIEALKNVTINEPFFQGHFPAKPVMPGVLMLEGMAQAGGVLAYSTELENVGVKLLYFAGIDKVRFRRPVGPGDQLIYKLEVLKKKRGIWKLAGKAFVDDKVVAEAELMASFG